MNVSIGVPAMAPQTTGHPAALPEDATLAVSDQKVAEAPANGDAQGADAQAGQSGSDSFPPSAIQRKILELLEKQVADLDAS